MTTPTTHITLASSLDQFTRELDKSPLTIQAYRTDIQQFLTWLSENDVTVARAHHVTRSHINEYLRYLANKGRTSTTCARKLVSLHTFFTYLVQEGIIPHSPAATVNEYRRMLAVAKGSPRDYAFLQFMLQTGIRVSELIAICVLELDLEHKMLTIHGKGSKERVLPLEKKALQALQAYLAVRPKTTDQHLFLNYQGKGLSIGGVRKMVEKYLKRVGITKKVSCHDLHYMRSTNRAALEMNAFYLRTLLGQERVRKSKVYMQIGTENHENLWS